MNTDTVGYDALDDRQDRAANNSHIQKARATSTQSPEFRLSQTENGGEHDRVEEANCENRPHGGVSVGQHGSDDQSRRRDRAKSKQISGFESLQKRSADEAPNHGAAPVEGNISRRDLSGQGGNLGQAKIIHQKASD